MAANHTLLQSSLRWPFHLMKQTLAAGGRHIQSHRGYSQPEAGTVCCGQRPELFKSHINGHLNVPISDTMFPRSRHRHCQTELLWELSPSNDLTFIFKGYQSKAVQFYKRSCGALSRIRVSDRPHRNYVVGASLWVFRVPSTVPPRGSRMYGGGRIWLTVLVGPANHFISQQTYLSRPHAVRVWKNY